MVRCLSYWNSMSDIVYKKKNKIFSSYKNVRYYCFQSAEVKESGGRFSDNLLVGIYNPSSKGFRQTDCHTFSNFHVVYAAVLLFVASFHSMK